MPSTTTQTGQTMDLVIHLDELAKVLRVSPDNLKRTWLKRHQTKGMPRKHSGGWFWARKAIEIWLTSQACVSADPVNDNAGEATPDLHAQRVAEQRAGLHELLGVSQ